MKESSPAAVIFDQDGTLVQSELLWPEIDAEYFTSLLGVEGWDRWQPKWLDLKGRGMPLDEILFLLKRMFALEGDVADMKARREDMMSVRYTERLMRCDGAETALRFFASRQIPVAIASGMSIRIIETVCRQMGWESLVSVLASTHETGKSKPDPSIYLLAAERLEVEPGRCVAFENDLNGFRSATAAGMSCQAIPDTPERCRDFQARRIQTFSSLHEAIKRFM